MSRKEGQLGNGTEEETTSIPERGVNMEGLDSGEVIVELPEEEEDTSKKKDQKEHEPPPSHPRFKQIYKDNKVKERVIEEQNLQIEELIMNTKRLQNQLDSFQSEYVKDKTDTRLSKVENLMRDAVEAGDVEAFDKLKEQYKKTQADGYAPEKTTYSTSSPEKDLEMFKEFNPWYESDYAKTQYALRLDAELKKDPVWKSKTNAQFLAEIAKRTQAHFRDNSGGSSFTAPTDGVGSGTFKPDASSSKKVILSQTQRKMAERLFNDLSKEEAYKKYASNL